jgi:hypothetical protein
MCFQGLCWTKMETVFGTCVRLVKNWKILSKLEEVTVLGSTGAGNGEKRCPQAMASFPFESGVNGVINCNTECREVSFGADVRAWTGTLYCWTFCSLCDKSGEIFFCRKKRNPAP